jgi:hypothetical protein
MTTVKMLPPAEVADYPDDLKGRFVAAVHRYNDAAARDEQVAALAEINATVTEARHRRAN